MKTIIDIGVGKEGGPFTRLRRTMDLNILPHAEDEFYIETTGGEERNTISLEVSGTPCFVADFYGGIRAEIVLRISSLDADELTALNEIGWVKP